MYEVSINVGPPCSMMRTFKHAWGHHRVICELISLASSVQGYPVLTTTASTTTATWQRSTMFDRTLEVAHAPVELVIDLRQHENWGCRENLLVLLICTSKVFTRHRYSPAELMRTPGLLKIISSARN
jgi:hypothetical protein